MLPGLVVWHQPAPQASVWKKPRNFAFLLMGFEGSFMGGYLRVPLKGYYKSTIRIPLLGGAFKAVEKY